MNNLLTNLFYTISVHGEGHDEKVEGLDEVVRDMMKGFVDCRRSEGSRCTL